MAKRLMEEDDDDDKDASDHDDVNSMEEDVPVKVNGVVHRQ